MDGQGSRGGRRVGSGFDYNGFVRGSFLASLLLCTGVGLISCRPAQESASLLKARGTARPTFSGELAFLNGWDFVDSDALIRTQGVSETQIRETHFVIYQFRIADDDQKIAGMLKRTLLAKDGWKVRFPDASSWDCRAEKFVAGRPTWSLKTMSSRRGKGNTTLLIWDESKPIYRN